MLVTDLVQRHKNFAMIKYDRINLVFNSSLLNFGVWVHIVRKTNKFLIKTIRNG